MTSKNKVEVRIQGKDYKLLGVESEEYMQRVAFYIDRKMNEVSSANNRLSTAMTAVLTSINVADDYYKSAGENRELKQTLKNNSEEAKSNLLELEKLRLENESLKETIQNLRIEFAKKETELSDFINNFDGKGKTYPSNKDNMIIMENARKSMVK